MYTMITTLVTGDQHHGMHSPYFISNSTIYLIYFDCTKYWCVYFSKGSGFRKRFIVYTWKLLKTLDVFFVYMIYIFIKHIQQQICIMFCENNSVVFKTHRFTYHCLNWPIVSLFLFIFLVCFLFWYMTILCALLALHVANLVITITSLYDLTI